MRSFFALDAIVSPGGFGPLPAPLGPAGVLVVVAVTVALIR